MREQFPDAVGVFILPPSREALEARLQRRGQDSEEVIARRMRDAVREMSHYAEFEYLVINDDFTTALEELRSIVTCHRLATPRQQARHADLLARLLA